MRALALIALIASVALIWPARSPAAGGKPVEWRRWGAGAPTSQTHRIGDLVLTGAIVDRDQYTRTAVLRIASASTPPLEIEGESAGPGSTAGEVLVARLDRSHAQPVVIFRSFTGGAHCCLAYKLIRREGAGWRVRELGQWDTGAAPQIVDVDGDGRLELLARDQRFQYRFTSYAESLAPPVVLELVEDRLRDVSHQPQYKGVFTRVLSAYRRRCAKSRGACAGYVATAARAGKADAAFAVLDRSAAEDDRRPGAWTAPESCGAQPGELPLSCREQPTKAFATYREAVAWFLNDLGYLPEPNRQAKR